MKKMMLWLTALMLITGAGRAQECLDYRMTTSPQTGIVTINRWLDAMDASDTHFCYARTEVVGGQRIIYWCDINADGTPNLLGQLAATGTSVTVLRVSGSRVAALHEDGAWQVVEFADPVNPVLIGSMGPERGCKDLDLDGNLVFAAETTGIGVYELMPDGPLQERSRFATPPPEYLPGGASRFVSLDVEDSRCWAILDDVFNFDHFPKLVVLDVSDPQEPTLSQSYSMRTCLNRLCSFAATIRADGSRAVLSNTELGYTQIYRLTNAPYIYVELEIASGGGWRLNGDWAYSSDHRGLTYYHYAGGGWREAGSWPSAGDMVAVSSAGIWAGGNDPQAAIAAYPPQLSAYRQPGMVVFDPPERVEGMISAGHRLLLRERTWGDDHIPFENWLSVIDVNDPLAPTYLHRLDYPRCSGCLVYAASENHVYTNFGIWDLATGELFSTDSLRPLATIGPALWCRGASALDIYDLADPTAPLFSATFSLPANPIFVASTGARAAVAAGQQVFLLDTGDPLAPVELSNVTFAGSRILGVWMNADALYVSYCTDIAPYCKFEVFRINGEGSLGQSPSFSSSEWLAQGVVLDGALMYVVSPDGLRIFDIAAPTNPIEVGSHLDGAGFAWAAKVGDFVYTLDAVNIGSHGPGLVRAFPRQCPISISESLRDLSVRWLEHVVRVSWYMDHPALSVRVLARAEGLERTVPWRTQDGQWEAIDQQAPPGQTVNYVIQAYVDGQWIHLAEQSLTVPATSLVLEDAIPNPFNPATRLRYTLDAAGFVELAIYDTAGRRLCTLASGRQDVGPHSVIWRGLDDAGRPVPAGMYLARLTTPHGARSVKLTLLQ